MIRTLRLGAAVSRMQSALFVAIGVAALALGPVQLVEGGLATVAQTQPGLFRVLCLLLLAIAWLGLAITPAEEALVARWNAAWAAWSARTALLGHGATMVFFGWWLLVPDCLAASQSACDMAGSMAPLAFGLVFELGLVGSWVLVIAWAAYCDQATWPRGFLWLSIAKAMSFWAAYLAVLANRPLPLLLSLGVVTLVTGPWWHAWVARIMTDARSDTGDDA